MRTLESDGRLDAGTIKPSTVRKLLRQAGLDRVAVRDGSGAKTRLRWQAAAPDALWHADVCHGPTLHLGGIRTPIRSSQHVQHVLLALAVVRARRLHGKPDVLFLDNGIHGMLDDCSRYVVALEAHQPRPCKTLRSRSAWKDGTFLC